MAAHLTVLLASQESRRATTRFPHSADPLRGEHRPPRTHRVDTPDLPDSRRRHYPRPPARVPSTGIGQLSRQPDESGRFLLGGLFCRPRPHHVARFARLCQRRNGKLNRTGSRFLAIHPRKPRAGPIPRNRPVQQPFSPPSVDTPLFPRFEHRAALTRFTIRAANRPAQWPRSVYESRESRTRRLVPPPNHIRPICQRERPTHGSRSRQTLPAPSSRVPSPDIDRACPASRANSGASVGFALRAARKTGHPPGVVLRVGAEPPESAQQHQFLIT
jgi:hypothetical protein